MRHSAQTSDESLSPQPRALGKLELGVPWPDVALAYTDWGEPDAEQVVVCVHGLTRNARDFDFLAQALAARGLRAIAVDVAGRGLSSWLADPQGYAVPTYAAQMLRFLELMKLGPVDWVGTSMGGLIGMVLAAREAPPLRRLVLNDVGPFVPAEALKQIQAYLGIELSFESLEALESHLRAIHASFGPLTDSQWRHLAKHSARETAEGWRLSYDPAIRVPFEAAAAEDIDLWPLWDAIQVPTLVLWGEESTLLTRATAEEMGNRGPKAEVTGFARVGHAPALMSQDQIATVVDWLRR